LPASTRRPRAANVEVYRGMVEKGLPLPLFKHHEAA
jgi:hypothetical protein